MKKGERDTRIRSAKSAGEQVFQDHRQRSDIINQTAALSDRAALAAAPEARKFFAYMASCPEVEITERNDRQFVTFKDLRELPQEVRDASGPARKYAKGVVSGEPSLRIGSNQGHFGGFGSRRKEYSISCELGEFVTICKQIGIKKLSPQILEAAQQLQQTSSPSV